MSAEGVKRMKRFAELRSYWLSGRERIADPNLRLQVSSLKTLETQKSFLFFKWNQTKLDDKLNDADTTRLELPIDDDAYWKNKLASLGRASQSRHALNCIGRITEYERQRSGGHTNDSRFAVLHQIKEDIVEIATRFQGDTDANAKVLNHLSQYLMVLKTDSVFDPSMKSAKSTFDCLDSVAGYCVKWKLELQGVKPLDELFQTMNTRLNAFLEQVTYPLLNAISEHPVPAGVRSALFMQESNNDLNVRVFLDSKYGRFLCETLLMPLPYENKTDMEVGDSHYSLPAPDQLHYFTKQTFVDWFAKRKISRLIKGYFEDRARSKGIDKVTMAKQYAEFVEQYTETFMALRSLLNISYTILPDLIYLTKHVGSDHINSGVTEIATRVLAIVNDDIDVVAKHMEKINSILFGVGARKESWLLYLIASSPDDLCADRWFQNVMQVLSLDMNQLQDQQQRIKTIVSELQVDIADASKTASFDGCFLPKTCFVKDRLLHALDVLEVSAAEEVQPRARRSSDTLLAGVISKGLGLFAADTRTDAERSATVTPNSQDVPAAAVGAAFTAELDRAAQRLAQERQWREREVHQGARACV